MLSAIRGYPYKKQQQAITKSLKGLRLHKIAERKNITQKDLEEITRLKHLSLNNLKKIAQLRDVSVNGLKKEDIIYILLRSSKNLKETKYMEYLNHDTNSEIKTKINEIRKDLVNLITPIDNKFKPETRERLNEIEKMTRINRKQKTELLHELSKIDLDLQYKRKSFDLTNDDNNYIGVKNIEYILENLDDFYKPVLAKESFNGNYQLYTCRGDKNRDMSIDTYLYKVKPYLFASIDEKKVTEKKYNLT